LIHTTPDISSEVDDLDYLLRDALWSSHDSAPEPARVLAALRARIAGAQRPADVYQAKRVTRYSPPYETTAFLYLMPLMRMTH
jgi:hypothetical protein